MPPVNPNTLSDAEYWARVNGQPAPTVPQGWLAQMAADIAGRGGVAVQQNGYDANAAVPVAAGPAWAGPSPLPAYPRSGAHMTMPGSQEAWEQWGVPPVMMQSDPYATAAYRTYTDPYGQIGVQPLIGFPSRYPHVLSGVPNSPFRVQGFINALLPQAGFMPFIGMPQMPIGMQPRAQGTGNNNSNNTNKNTAPRVSSNRPPFLYGDTDTMPLPASYQRPTPQIAQTPQVNRSLDGTYLPAATPQINRQFDGTYLPPVAPQAVPQVPQQLPQIQVDPSFTPNLLSVEEAEELADGMYVDPNKTLMQNLLEGLGMASIPLSLGAGPLLYSAPRIAGGAVVPETAGALPSAIKALP